MNFKKNQELETEITDLSVDGMGIGKVNGFAFFVFGAAPGDIIKMQIVKLKKNYGYGIIKDIIKSSPIRTVPDCKHFGKCGGCNLRHISYSAQLDFKQNTVKGKYRVKQKDKNSIERWQLPYGLYRCYYYTFGQCSLRKIS